MREAAAVTIHESEVARVSADVKVWVYVHIVASR